MKLLLKTKILMFLSVVAFGSVVIALQPKSAFVDALPSLEALTRKDLVRIALTSMGNTITLERQDEGWAQVAPLKGVADMARINAMILNFRKDIPMDVLIESNPENAGRAYGLDSSNAITVEIWSGDSAEPSLSFLIGNDAGQGASFVRISGDKSVYRANVGGRRRFSYTANDWLNQRVFLTEMSELASVEVQSSGHPMYTLENGGDAWTVKGITGPLAVSRLAKALQDLLIVRKSNVVENATITDPWLTMLLQTKDGKKIPVRVAAPVDRLLLVEVNGVVYQAPALSFEHFARGADYFVDQRVFSIRSRDELDLIRYTTAVTDIIIQQDLSNGFWKVLQPSNVDLEMRDAFFMVNTLATLSSIAEVPLLEGQDPKLTLEIRRLQGDVLRLKVFEEYNQAGVVGYRCQVDGMDTGFIAAKDDMDRIINGFGQANIF